MGLVSYSTELMLLGKILSLWWSVIQLKLVNNIQRGYVTKEEKNVWDPETS